MFLSYLFTSIQTLEKSIADRQLALSEARAVLRNLEKDQEYDEQELIKYHTEFARRILAKAGGAA